ncbi:MAG: alpha-hydroxy-acid oxidizing protein [Clostridia bacterium]|nr:alpha-hydroxy-acid oxidizing protein [Clostridia bacterium]
MERKTSSSDVITRAYIDSLLVEVRHLDAVMPSTEMTLFGKTFATPVATAALSHMHNQYPDGMAAMADGANQAGALVFSGMGPKDELERMVQTGAQVIKIIKPYADRDSVYDKIRHAEEIGCLAVGIDTDHAFNRSGHHRRQAPALATPGECKHSLGLVGQEPDLQGVGYDCIEGMEMFPLSSAELKDMVASTKLPFFIKGVLSRKEARKCLDCGVKGMVVSHHNGRLECAVPPLMVLPEIAEEVNGEAALFVDCAIQSGLDVFKCLALGATGACVGRPLMQPLREKGPEGVRETIAAITNDLRYAMAMTASPDVKSIDPSIVRLAKHVW